MCILEVFFALIWKKTCYEKKGQNLRIYYNYAFFLQILAFICRENCKQTTGRLQTILMDFFFFSMNLCIDSHTKKCNYCVLPLWGSTQQKPIRIFPFVCGLMLKINFVTTNTNLWFFHIYFIKIIINFEA